MRVGIAVTFYPSVLPEAATLQRVLSGSGLARYGDGEINIALGHGIPCQRFDTRLQVCLRGILKDSGDCLVGIPNIHSLTPKFPFWKKYLTLAPPVLHEREYGSAFISRPDSAPWIDTTAYWTNLERLWVGKDVTLVRGSVRSLVADDLMGATSVREIIGPVKDAWSEYGRLRTEIGQIQSECVLLCLGPTATVLAADLCRDGVHAVDLGHAGTFLNKHRRGEPMTMTQHDRDLVLKNARPAAVTH